ncbi:hypothetical protein BGX28_002650 [Mortierella sp. GBA30]|nr:hypothetical protein BGX28_002650 [Mortierella sp. GBA30]
MDSIDSLKAFARNSHHVETLSANPIFISLLYNCLLAYQALYPPPLDQAIPAWLPRPDSTPYNSMLIPIPPLVSLLSFFYRREVPCYHEDHPLFTSVCKLTAVLQGQVYGVIYHSSRLKKLSLDISINGLRDTRLLAAAVCRMENLQRIYLQDYNFGWPQTKFIPTIVACCPPSLAELCICRADAAELLEAEERKTEEEKEAEEKALRNSMPLLEEGNGLPVVPRKGKLGRLFRLFSDVNPSDVAKCIGEHCQKVNNLDGRHGRASQLLMDTMNALPMQTVQVFTCPQFDKSSADLASCLLRHSTSLREVNLNYGGEFDSKAVQSILVHCQALETFSFIRGAWLKPRFNLADAIEFPWASTSLKNLGLLIAMDYIEPTSDGPFYNRMPPVNLTAAEYSQTMMLEKLYCQIGRLVNMETLSLQLVVPKHPTVITDYTSVSFPGLLSLPRENSDRLGYLHLMVGLKKLRRLYSCVERDDTVKSMGQPEVEWIVQNWPSLEDIDLLGNIQPGKLVSPSKPPCFQWLHEQMPRLKMDSIWYVNC